MKKRNSYQEMLSQDFFEKTPKSVFAALAVSFMFNFQGNDTRLLLEQALLEEWQCLFDQGIVPQKPMVKK